MRSAPSPLNLLAYSDYRAYLRDYYATRKTVDPNFSFRYLSARAGINSSAYFKLLPATYDPSHPDSSVIRKSITNGNGRYRFDSVDTTRLWNIIAGDKVRNGWAMARDLRPGKAAPLNLSAGKVFLVTLHVSDYAIADSGIAFFPGTDILTRCDAHSISTLDSVPAQALRFVVESRAGWKYDTTLVAITDTASVRADRNQIIITP